MKYTLADWQKAEKARHLQRDKVYSINKVVEKSGIILVHLENFSSETPEVPSVIVAETKDGKLKLEPIFGEAEQPAVEESPPLEDPIRQGIEALKAKWIKCGFDEEDFDPTQLDTMEALILDAEEAEEELAEATQEEAEELIESGEAEIPEEAVIAEEEVEEAEDEQQDEEVEAEEEAEEELTEEDAPEAVEPEALAEAEPEPEKAESEAKPVARKARTYDPSTVRMLKVVNEGDFIDAYDFLLENGIITNDTPNEEIEKQIVALYDAFNKFVAGCQYSGEFRKVKTRQVSTNVVFGYTEMIKRIVDAYPGMVKFGLVEDKFKLEHK